MQNLDLSFIKKTYWATPELLRMKLPETSKNDNSYDSYIFSSVYYLFTGRKGLWVNAGQHGNTIVISVHPNKDNSLLLFPVNSELKNINFEYIESLAYKISLKYPNIELQISRVHKKLNDLVPKNFMAIEENFLDWKYPVHVLDTKAVYDLKGKNFQQVRQRINQLDCKKCVVSKINIESDIYNLRNVGQEWANGFNHECYSYNDLTDPSHKLLEMMRNNELNLQGQKIEYNGQIKSFCIWEKSDDMANEFAISSDKKIFGLSEYQMYKMCAYLHNDGVSLLNIGGSETEGLDRFKKKFSPIISHNLQTYIIKTR